MKNQSSTPTKNVLFHIGRGGRHNNPGYTTCKGLIDSFNPDYYGLNFYFRFANSQNNALLYDALEKSKRNIYVNDLIESYTSQELEAILLELKINIADDEEAPKFLTLKDLGEAIVTNESDNELCTYAEFISDNGRVNIDHGYDTYFWKPINELSDDEIEIMKRDLRSYEYESYLEETV